MGPLDTLVPLTFANELTISVFQLLSISANLANSSILDNLKSLIFSFFLSIVGQLNDTKKTFYYEENTTPTR